MSDRLVRPLDQQGVAKAEKFLFSEFNDARNIVLLGDPGAGKTHLFRHFANLSGGRYLTARNFLIIPPDTLQGVDYLFIDALDEKRSGRGADSTIDQIASRLAEIAPSYVRLACRAADWLGDYDLSALEAVLPIQDEITILALEALSSEEQHNLLISLGEKNSESFLRTASERGLGSMLTNPQTLKMLWEQVGARGWPTTRRELFANSVELLVSEHNSTHLRQSSTHFTQEERLQAAGAACALRLISDIKGIGLQEVSNGDDCPSYRDVSLTPPNRLLDVLSSRLFMTDEAVYIADYLHRTLAEFSAARWLADLIRAGFPFGRVKALITHEGIPTTELRGLNAWLSVHLQEHAIELIDADPFGVMTYGDPASLSPHTRLHLVDALAKLAERDPWFRSGHWDTPVYGLGQPDLVPRFREILSDDDKPHSLRSIVLDAIYEGRIAGEMLDTLRSLTLNSSVGISERLTATDAILQAGKVGHEEILNIYTNLSNSKDDLQIRSHLIRSMYGKGVGHEELSLLLSEALYVDADLPIGTFWGLDKVIPDGDIRPILEAFNPPSKSLDDLYHHNNSDIVHVIDNLICRGITGDTDPDPTLILSWLDKRARVVDLYNQDSGNHLRAVLAENRRLLVAVTKRYLASGVAANEPWHVIHEFEKLMAGAADWSIALECACTALNTENSATHPFYLETALGLALQLGPLALEEFDSLLSLRDKPELTEVIDIYSVCQITDWQKKNIERRIRKEAERRESREQHQKRFDENMETILEGRHLGWMGFIGLIYFSRFSDLNAEASPNQRLTELLSTSQAEKALVAIEKFASEGQYPSVEEVLELSAQRKYQKYWYAIIAGLCELHDKDYSLDLIDDQRLRSALIIDCLYPTFTTKGRISSQRQHSWKSELLERRPTFVADVYAQVARHYLGTGNERIVGLHELLNYRQLADVRSGLVIQLLREFPVCEKNALKHLIASALSDAPGELRELIPLGRTAAEESGDIAPWVVWTVYGLLLDVPCCLEDIKRSDDANGEMLIWALRDAFVSNRNTAGLVPEQGTEIIEEFVIQFVGSRIPWTEHPEGGWVGDTKPWDATEFVVAQINKLAASPTLEATDALQRLIEDDSLVSYRQCLLHALATQRVQRADANFEPPTWFEVQETLTDGAPANITDLQALVMTHIQDIGRRITGANTDPYKQFWNVDMYGRVLSPKPEEDCRDALVEMLRPLLAPLGLRVEPEGHMASDKRADICVLANGMKLVIELKRDYHTELWVAIEQQLDRFYTRDPEAHGYGIYGVFWFGEKRPRRLQSAPTNLPLLNTANDLENALKNGIPASQREKIQVFVLDVSGLQT